MAQSHLESAFRLRGTIADIHQQEGKDMKHSSMRVGFNVLGILLVGILVGVPALYAQYQPGNVGPGQAVKDMGTTPKANQTTPAKPPEGAPVADPAEEKAFKEISTLKPGDTDKIISLGEQFLEKYPTSKYVEPVEALLSMAYYDKKDYPKMYAVSDKALLLNPDEVKVLVVVGWVIPHFYDPNDLDSERRMAKAEQYEKHALELLPTLPKPDGVTDADFEKSKAEAESQAHSGLGLIYFRRQQFAEAVPEFQLSIKLAVQPDPVDLFILGTSLNQLKRFGEAADAFQKCVLIPSGVQDRCKQGLDQAKKQAAAQPAPPKQ
jgi:tetratricopeptide (TPR) repeat protein